ncbi:zinc finger domain-containing protein [Thermomonas alba]|uniref:zinc finger domain-containing protein n=1 Tax=Thermomonas alba TaxID=2888525 RepID=UPI0034E1A176
MAGGRPGRAPCHLAQPARRAGDPARAGEAFRFRVFQRDGQPCERCGTPIARIASQSRPLFLCPHCQPARPPK